MTGVTLEAAKAGHRPAERGEVGPGRGKVSAGEPDLRQFCSLTAHGANCCSSCCPRRSRRGCSAARSRISTGLLRDKLAAAEIPGGEPARLCHAAPSHGHRRGHPAAQPDRTEERRGPRVGAPRPAIDGFLRSAGLASIEECEIRDTGRGEFYFAIDQPAGPARRRGAAGSCQGGDLRAALAEIDALSGFVAALGAAADFGHLPVRRRGPAAARSTGSRSGGSLAATAFCRRARFASAMPPNISTALARLMSCSIRIAEGKDRGRSRARGSGRGRYASSRIRGCSKRSPASSNFRSCSPARSTPISWRCRPKCWRRRCGRIRSIFPACSPTARRLRDFCSSPTISPPMAARRSLPATNGCCGRGSPMRGFSGTRTASAARVARRGAVGAGLSRQARQPAGQGRDGWSGWPSFSCNYVPGADPLRSRRAVQLAKADLSTGMVGEFPELQGIMGRYYALHDGEHPAVAEAIAEHYRPLGPNDACPTAPGQRRRRPRRQDRFARRVLCDRRKADRVARSVRAAPRSARHDPAHSRKRSAAAARGGVQHARIPCLGPGFADPTGELLDFIAERLRVHLREQGIGHDLIAAVFAPARRAARTISSGCLRASRRCAPFSPPRMAPIC